MNGISGRSLLHRLDVMKVHPTAGVDLSTFLEAQPFPKGSWSLVPIRADPHQEELNLNVCNQGQTLFAATKKT